MTTCPKCHAEFESGGSMFPQVCPNCNVRLHRNVSGIVKTSVVMISAGGEDMLYRSVQQIPEPLRTLLEETTASNNSGTILIADRAGKEQLTQVLARREAKRDATDSASEPPAPVIRRRPPAISWIAWAGFLLVLALAGVTSAYFGLRW